MEIKIENKSCIKRKCDKKEMEKLVEVMILPSIGKGTVGGLQLNLHIYRYISLIFVVILNNKWPVKVPKLCRKQH